ncbi:MAG: DUF1223 domain-containing protein [Chthoniobacterales bacterium]
MTAAFTASAAETTFETGPQRTHLLELYTSEGCSSCPTAEAWLSKLKDDPRLWREFVPIAFHVDYWDRLGWRDPFASKNWTARQYAYSARWNNGSVYTPGFVLNGREWTGNTIPATAKENAGVFRVTVADDEVVKAQFSPDANDAGSYDLHVARLGFGLTTDVKAGENSGRKLQHDFVVLSLTNEPINGTREMHIAPSTSAKPGAREAIGAWVTHSGQLEPIQATGGWLR